MGGARAEDEAAGAETGVRVGAEEGEGADEGEGAGAGMRLVKPGLRSRVQGGIKGLGCGVYQ